MIYLVIALALALGLVLGFVIGNVWAARALRRLLRPPASKPVTMSEADMKATVRRAYELGKMDKNVQNGAAELDLDDLAAVSTTAPLEH